LRFDRPLVIDRTLEEGRLDGPLSRLAARAWQVAAERTLVRRLHTPRGVHVVAVGGATLGGSGKTPIAIACARTLAAAGARTVLVGHGYRARPQRPRVVSTGDSTAEVGDEALIAARALEPVGAAVVVGPTRSTAVAWAGRRAEVLVIDGVLQTAPVRATLALLAVDADEPWGHAQSLPPRGDLRAPIAALLAASDAAVRVGDERSMRDPRSPWGPLSSRVRDSDAWVVSRGAWLGGSLVEWGEIASRRVGLACALARPDRLLRFLARRNVRPVAIARASDHHAIHPRAMREPVDLWLATPKCTLHAPCPLGRGRGFAPLATIDHDVVLSPALGAALARLAVP
jgi:tetraacyldisaccharide 4'-kinase